MSRHFETTNWTVILRAAEVETESAREALESLCRAYWQPVYEWIRNGDRHSHEDAQDLTQAFFGHLLSRQLYADVHPSRGRFRAWLIAVLKIFLRNDRRFNSRLKRGGPGLRVVTLEDAESELVTQDTPDRVYEKKWAHTVLALAADRLRLDCERHGHLRRYEVLRPLIFDAARGEGATAEHAEALGLTLNATKVALARLRQRYRDMLRMEVARLVEDPADVDDELAHLADALR